MTQRKKKFLEKRKTYEYHEYPAHPLPLEIEEVEEDKDVIDGEDDTL